MGLFISLEGPEGGGKTTQARLLATELRGMGYMVLLTREPGGTAIGDRIRAVLLDQESAEMDPRAEILLYSASRAQHVCERIRPALASGQIVISDRYADSTLAYQGYGRGLDLDTLRAITLFATDGLQPDLTLCLDIAPVKGLERRRQGRGEWNRLDAETLAFHQRTRQGYLELAQCEPERWVVIDAGRPAEAVHAEIKAFIRPWLADRL